MFFYQQGDVIDNFYFGLTGTSAFIVPKEGYRIFSVIDPEKSLLPTKYKKHLLQYFGIEDSVVNHTAMSHDEKKVE